MLPKNNRLKKKKEFENVFKGGKGYKEGFLYLKVIDNNLKCSRFGFIVGKNFSKKAVLRNKARRKLRELARIVLPNINKNVDAVIIVRPGLDISDFQELEKKIAVLFEKSGIID